MDANKIKSIWMSGWDWSGFLLELVGFVKLSAGTGEISQECHWEWV